MSKLSTLAVIAGVASIPVLSLFEVSSAGASSTGASPAISSGRGHKYVVSVTNLTRGQIFSPPVVYTHNKKMAPLWTLGETASPELAAVAEDALNPVLIAKLNSSPHVRAVEEIKGAMGVIMPGETAKITIDGRRASHISMAGMLVITNDAFFGINGAELPRKGTLAHSSPAYDAGSEENNEQCAFIPGPPCMNPNVRATAGAEGYVHVHAGIHGIGSLKAETYDWRNGVAAIRIRRK